MRFDLVDAVIEQAPGRIVTLKGVTAAEEYLGDHFPGFPVLPGVMMLEAMVQAARRVAGEDGEAAGGDRAGPDWVLAEVRNVRYGSMVRPGQRLRLEVERTRHESDRHTFEGRGTVDDQVAVQGRFVLRPLSPPPPRGR